MNVHESGGNRGLEEQVDNLFGAMFGELTAQERTTIDWANQVLEEYNNLPKQTSRERRVVKKLITKTSGELLEDPQNIFIAHQTWRGHESSRDGARESEEPFSKLVRGECLAFIKEKWKEVKPEQLAQLVRIYANNNDPTQDYAKEMLRNYFKGPDSRGQRVDACYNFLSTTLDLAGENEALKRV